MRKITPFFRASLFFFLLFSTTGCEDKKESESHLESIPVVAKKPQLETIILYSESIGVLHPSVTSEIRPEANGKIEKVLVQEGDLVKKGEPLFIIASPMHQIRGEEIKAQIAIHKAELTAAEKKLRRYERLAEKNLIAQVEWDELQANVERARAMVELDQAKLKAVELDLADCIVKAAINGRVGKLDLHEGDLITQGQQKASLLITDLSTLTLEFKMGEKEFLALSAEPNRVALSSLCSGSYLKEGSVTFIDNHFDAKTGQILMRAKVDNQDLSLRSGQNVKVKIAASTLPDCLTIPQKAIRYNQEGAYVYIIQEDQTVAIRPLLLGGEHGKDQIVLEGLSPDEAVVLEGHLRLFPGAKVEVKP